MVDSCLSVHPHAMKSTLNLRTASMLSGSWSIVGQRSAMITSTLNLMIIILLRAYSSHCGVEGVEAHTALSRSPCFSDHHRYSKPSWSKGISATVDQMTSSSSQLDRSVPRGHRSMCQPNDMILFIEVNELGRLSLDASSSSMLLHIHHLRNHLVVARILVGLPSPSTALPSQSIPVS